MLCANCRTVNLKGMLFCAKCGRSLSSAAEDEEAHLPRMVWQVGDGTPQTYLLTKAVTTIGRVSGNDIILPETGVSRQHARIEYDGTRLVVVDLGSLNGTYVNDERVEQARELRNGD
ncbi:MAG: FHA domain-containing protein, partial [Chloroflexi bacterium]|nr:FHA domain-containing protein [Chloroflexota bacterium]